MTNRTPHSDAHSIVVSSACDSISTVIMLSSIQTVARCQDLIVLAACAFERMNLSSFCADLDMLVGQPRVKLPPH